MGPLSNFKFGAGGREGAETVGSASGSDGAVPIASSIGMSAALDFSQIAIGDQEPCGTGGATRGRRGLGSQTVWPVTQMPAESGEPVKGALEASCRLSVACI